MRTLIAHPPADRHLPRPTSRQMVDRAGLPLIASNLEHSTGGRLLTSAARFRKAVVVGLALVAPSAWAAQNGGGVMGWVADPGGAPVAGALVSLFGRGTGGVVTLSDSTGRFFLPSLPAGSYTVRAMTRNKLAAPPRQITVLPNRDYSFTVALEPD